MDLLLEDISAVGWELEKYVYTVGPLGIGAYLKEYASIGNSLHIDIRTLVASLMGYYE